jgi:tetratricopeptide (TPR) repeat protein
LIRIGEYERATGYINKTLEIDPNDITCLFYLADIHIRKKEFDKAEEAISKAEKIDPDDRGIQIYRARLLAAKGEKEKALAIRRDSHLYSLLGMKDEAIEFIRSNMDERRIGDPYSYLALINNPLYESLRDDPRFQEIVKKQKEVYEERIKKYGDL